MEVVERKDFKKLGKKVVFKGRGTVRGGRDGGRVSILLNAETPEESRQENCSWARTVCAR